MKQMILVTFLLLNGCVVSQDMLDKAMLLCKPHGGVKFLWGELATNSVDVVCQDGTVISKKLTQ